MLLSASLRTMTPRKGPRFRRLLAELTSRLEIVQRWPFVDDRIFVLSDDIHGQ